MNVFSLENDSKKGIIFSYLIAKIYINIHFLRI